MYFYDHDLFAIQHAQPLTMGEIMKSLAKQSGSPARMYEGRRLIGF